MRNITRNRIRDVKSMLTENTIQQHISELQNFSILVDTYKIIAVATIQKIKKSVLENRVFHMGLASIFQEVKRSYLKALEAEAILGKIDEKRLSFVKHNRKTMQLVLTANTGLYGELINRVFEFFWNAWNKMDGDPGVVGKVGKLLFASVSPRVPFRYYDFPDNQMDIEALRKISRELTEYERVIVYHGRFRSLFFQEPTSSEISGLVGFEIGKEKEEKESTEKRAASYIFEPSLEAVAIFFETEIFASLLEQTFNESRLAKISSRAVLLDSASVKIEKALERLVLDKQRVYHMKINRKQINMMSGVTLWAS